MTGDLPRPEGSARYDKTLALLVALERRDHIDPAVDRAMAWLGVAHAREEAIRPVDQGEFRRASLMLVAAAERLAAWGRTTPRWLPRKRTSSPTSSVSVGDRRSEDRKNHAARSH